MQLVLPFVVAICIAVEVVSRSSEGFATCSSLNGPFCQGFGSKFLVASPHEMQNLDAEQSELVAAKKLKIENVLKQYELQNVEKADSLGDESDIEYLRKIRLLLKENMMLTDAEKKTDSKDSKASALGSATNAALELLRLMNGDELKDFFEMALNVVLETGEATLKEMSPQTVEGLHTTVYQLKALKDYSTYQFQQLDELELLSIRLKFVMDRIVELQQAFENLVIADNAKDRQVAFETAVYLFQLAQENSM